MEKVDIFVKVVACKDKTGKAFNAYETTDKHGNKVNVRFTLETSPIKESSYIRLLDWWEDKRKVYPTIRVRKYDILETPEKETKTNIEF